MDLPEQSITYMDPDMYKAAVQGKIDRFESYGTSFNQILTPNKNTILHVYLKNQSREPKSTDFVDRILEKCPPLLLQPNIKGEIPLHFAARHDLANVVTVLIDRAKDLPFDLESGLTEAKKMSRTINVEKDTALHVAAQNLRSRVVEILTKEDPEFSYSANHYGATPLYLVTNMNIFGRPKATAMRTVIDTILKNCKLVDYGGPNGKTALHAAVMNGDYVTVKTLLPKEQSLTKIADENGWSPLHYAAYFSSRDSTSIVKILLKYDVSAAYNTIDTDKKRTALHIAAIQGNAEVMEEIVSACPACCELVDSRGWNALHCAVASTRRREVFEKAVKIPKLVQLIYEKDDEGNTPLHLLAVFDKFSWLELPLEFQTVEGKMGGVNKQGLSVDNILQGNFPRKKKEILKSIEDVGSGPFELIVMEEEKKAEEEKRPSLEDESLDKIREAHLVVAALIATVTFAAAFTLPGGYKNEQGPNEGTAILTKKAAFIAFLISDTIAMVLSLSAVFIHFFLPFLRARNKTDKDKIGQLVGLATGLTLYAIYAMVMAFITGTYAVLATSLGLAITTCFIGDEVDDNTKCLLSFLDSKPIYNE
ncbi:unnamed protein product [Dovyalis caffra]|uniref:PGG domain-containing protein n=1 Tax=Dovyalis caffra TaxID=77055 RepID=A0AAV1SEP2_9ROSI|nr:unnamed protein product [Dovyalis caffra]